jgi:hypothetical protein
VAALNLHDQRDVLCERRARVQAVLNAIERQLGIIDGVLAKIEALPR